ncbi:ester cyclase [Nocardia sp. ET3-3]|uniref:Ester cyclase n=1 Tax=Nocardia terrae TaxID=2675851 RepID=A0A7K1VBL9_9NOCA|nr:ester cyclase [Nocardia terrae]MVU84044.1 ester cyclase [Nocardia terrae]
MNTTAVADNKTVITAFIDALNHGLEGGTEWVRYLSPQVIDHNKVIFGEEDTPGAAIEGFRQQLAAFSATEDAQSGILVQELIGEDDRIVARLRVIGRHTGAHARMPEPTGRTCDVEQIWIFTLTDSRITEIRAVSDRLGMFLQLGWDWPTVD